MAVGQIIGPLKVGDNFYTTIQIKGWKDRLAVTETQQQQRWDDVKERLTHRSAVEIYRQKVAQIMKGKQVDFERDTFFEVAELLQPFYLKTPEEKQEAFNKKFWKDEDSFNPLLDENMTKFEQMQNEPLLKIDGQVWTVGRLRKEMASHPLVFRKREISNSEFPNQLRLAIVDLIQDKYVTEQAYKKGYDKVNVVERNAGMWRDYVSAQYQRNEYLKSIGAADNFASDYMKIMDEHLNAYVDSLQAKYNDLVKIDTDKFEDIQLTRIDLFVTQKNMPYPIVVPTFPVLTTDKWLDYGEKVSFP